MSGAYVSGIIFANTTFPDGTNSDSDGGTCAGHGGRLSRSSDCSGQAVHRGIFSEGTYVFYRVRKTLDTRDNETEKRMIAADSERTEILAEITALTVRVDRIADTLDRVDRNTHQVAVELARQSGQLEEHLHSPRSG